jgi:type I restriction enzyme M protein
MEACIIICNNNKTDKRKGKILFIDAKDEVTRKNAESYLEDTHIVKIAQAFKDFENIEGFAKVVGIGEIVANNKSKLSVKRYVRPIASAIELSIEECVSEWSIATSNASSLIDGLIMQIEK